MRWIAEIFRGAPPAGRGMLIGAAIGLVLIVWVVLSATAHVDRMREACEARGGVLLKAEGSRPFVCVAAERR